jgi:hypothetical protein
MLSTHPRDEKCYVTAANKEDKLILALSMSIVESPASMDGNEMCKSAMTGNRQGLCEKICNVGQAADKADNELAAAAECGP